VDVTLIVIEDPAQTCVGEILLIVIVCAPTFELKEKPRRKTKHSTDPLRTKKFLTVLHTDLTASISTKR